MSRFPNLLNILKVLLVLAVLVYSLGFYKSGGIATEIKLPAAMQHQQWTMENLFCEEYRIPARLTPDSWFEFDVVGELCWSGELQEQVLQVLVSGAGYGPVYWDFPYQPETYSYKLSALKSGHATFNYSRAGIGESDHPFGFLVNVDSHAYMLKQIIDFLKERHAIGPLITVGHSLGSVVAIAHAINYPENLSGVILTGFVHNSNPAFSLAMRDGVDLAPFSNSFFGDIVDPTYMVSKDDTREATFYTMTNTDPMVPLVDELNRQTLTVGEIISMIEYFGPQSKKITVPVLIVTGEDDFVVCGGALDCTDHEAIVKYEQAFFSEQACIETIILDDTNHNINLHKNAPQSYRLMNDWVTRRVGAGCTIKP
jgi:pimeloyl-ACP methyl ester carboxylesterase